MAVEHPEHGVNGATVAGCSPVDYAARTPPAALSAADRVLSMPVEPHGAVYGAVELGA